jgi:cellulose synthase/poly-beta-1,6-N-acetylglucosamine synthase-like glycosyltransferase
MGAKILFFVSFFGLFGMTWLWVVLAYFVFKSSGKKIGSMHGLSVSRIDILLPVHNEEALIEASLESFRAAILELNSLYPQIQVGILIGLDACTDQTMQIAKNLNVPCVEVAFKNKWKNLVSLVRHRTESQGANMQGDWVILADAGVIWPKRFLLNMIPSLMDSQVMGIAPAYYRKNSGILEQLHWIIERYFKRLESTFAGGPISVHGATVLYRRSELEKALLRLKAKVWAADDVVVPLVMRAIYPNRRIVYVESPCESDRIIDQGVLVDHRSLTRSRRMVLGNLQWIKHVLPFVIRADCAVGLLAMRRVFRMLWLYWLLSLGVGVVWLGLQKSPAVGIGIVFLYLFLGLVMKKSLGPILSSLLVPFYFCSNSEEKNILWS